AHPALRVFRAAGGRYALSLLLDAGVRERAAGPGAGDAVLTAHEPTQSARWISMSPSARLVAVRQPGGVKVIDLDAKSVVEVLESEWLGSFACTDAALWMVEAGRLSRQPLPAGTR